MNNHECKTYFAIKGKFSPNEIIDVLGIDVDKLHSEQDLRRDRKPYGFAFIEIGLCDEYDVDMNNMAHKTISGLENIKEKLLEVKAKYKCDFVLEAVVKISSKSDKPYPILPTGEKVIRFCNDTKTKLDIDYYFI